jgi:DNA-directed RNA polymerase subunit L
MGEVMRRPLILTSQNGDTFTVFDDNHTLGDILRWLCENKSNAEDLLSLITLQLEKEYGS